MNEISKISWDKIKPYKNPTLLLYFRYSPILISSYYDPDIDAFIEEEGGPSSRPYCVDKVSYKKIESACSTFMDKLQAIIKISFKNLSLPIKFSVSFFMPVA